MNTNELEGLEKYHKQMAKLYTSHVHHHEQLAKKYHDRRLQLKQAVDIKISKGIAAEAIRKFSEQKSR